MTATRRRAGWRHLFMAACLMLGTAALAAPPVAGIVQGEVALVRQTQRLQVTEGLVLADADLLALAAGGFVQVERDTALLGLGAGAQVLLWPRPQPAARAGGAPMAYLLAGAAKLRPGPGDVAATLWWPHWEMVGQGALVVVVVPGGASVFVEQGSARLSPRGGPAGGTPLALRQGDFALLPVAGRPSVSQRLPAEFVQALPREFRDAMPARAAMLAARPRPAPKPLGAITYRQARPWLTAEPAVRSALARQWRPLAGDAVFRAELAAHLADHPEWERVLYPERFRPPPKPAPPRYRSRPAAPQALPEAPASAVPAS